MNYHGSLVHELQGIVDSACSDDAILQQKYRAGEKDVLRSGEDIGAWYLEHVVHLVGVLSQTFRLSTIPHSASDLSSLQPFRILAFLLLRVESLMASSGTELSNARIIHDIAKLYLDLTRATSSLNSNKAIHLMYVSSLWVLNQINHRLDFAVVGECDWSNDDSMAASTDNNNDSSQLDSYQSLLSDLREVGVIKEQSKGSGLIDSLDDAG